MNGFILWLEANEIPYALWDVWHEHGCLHPKQQSYWLGSQAHAAFLRALCNEPIYRPDLLETSIIPTT